MQNKILAMCFVICTLNVQAQNDFYNRGTINYEVKINNHKSVLEENEDQIEDPWVKQYLENTPKFSAYYYSLKFDNNKSIFSYTGRDEKIKKIWEDDQKEDDIWYTDFDKQQYINQKNVFGDVIKFEDSIRKINWKIVPNETREFVGYNCKKAIGVIFDSVYVFAYYSEAFTLSAGPMSITGLPGTIMAITIPRMNLSCIATSFNPLVNAAEIIPAKKGKIKPTTEIYKKVKEATSDYGSWAYKRIWRSFL